MASHRASSPLPEEECAIVGRWRQMHAPPLVWISAALRRRLDQSIAYRLKRMPQIVEKLARAGAMDLARMQDVGGCRVVLDTRDDVTAAEIAITARAAPHYEVVRTSDYRNEGRPDTGYRALHVIVRREGMQLEVQLRTMRQHAWAEAVERAANRTGYRLKDGDGPPEIVEYFRVASEGFALLDRGESMPTALRKRLAELHDALNSHLRDRPFEPGDLRRVAEKKLATPTNNWILIYNWRAGQLERWIDMGTDEELAAERYSAYEHEFSWRDGYEVVLIGSDSRETIEWTHAHYFGRSKDDLDPHGMFHELYAAA